MRNLLTTIALGIGLATTPMAALGIIVGEAGEALLIPWVRHGASTPGARNTLISVTIPATIGFDTVANSLTAPHVSPTNPGPTLIPADSDLVGGNAIHWYWFDSSGRHRRNGRIPVTADDLVWIDWRELSNGAFTDEDGYLVIGTETARTGAAADFAMLGAAWVEYAWVGGPESRVPIPVLPMNDGPDGDSGSAVSIADNVKYGAGGIPRAVSPLYSGMRTNRSDGILDDTTVFDLSLGSGVLPAVHVIWLDAPLALGRWRAVVGLEPEADQDCFDGPHLNDGAVQVLVQTPPADLKDTPCLEAGARQGTLETMPQLGSATYRIPEYIDTGINEPESAGIAFSITTEPSASGQPKVTSSPASARGTFK